MEFTKEDLQSILLALDHENQNLTNIVNSRKEEIRKDKARGYNTITKERKLQTFETNLQNCRRTLSKVLEARKGF